MMQEVPQSLVLSLGARQGNLARELGACTEFGSAILLESWEFALSLVEQPWLQSCYGALGLAETHGSWFARAAECSTL